MKVLGCLAIIFCFFSITLAQLDMGYAYPKRNSYFDYAEAMYRKPTEKELKLVAVETEFIERNKAFLSNENSGIFRLMPDWGCNENRNIIVAKEDCIKYSMPGSGSAFSFRENRYRVWRLADLTYKEGVFSSGSRYTLGIIGNLGDLDLNNVTLNTPAVKYLSGFVSVSEYKKIESQYNHIAEGFTVNDVLFSNKSVINENSTYILRSIAYRGKSYTAVANHVTYNEFEFDKRVDILIAFRVLKKDIDGSVTLLWKELQRQDSPKIKFPKEQ